MTPKMPMAARNSAIKRIESDHSGGIHEADEVVVEQLAVGQERVERQGRIDGRKGFARRLGEGAEDRRWS